MDYTNLIKQLIAALQALVALYTAQLAALPPQNTTTTVDTLATTTIVLVVPEISATSTQQAPPQIFGEATPPPPVQVGWDEGSLPFGVNGVVSNPDANGQIAGVNGVPDPSLLLFQYGALNGLYTKVTLTINGKDYLFDLGTMGKGQSSLATLVLNKDNAGLLDGNSYPYSVRIDAVGDIYAVKSGILQL